jgi:hypothetical protein
MGSIKQLLSQPVQEQEIIVNYNGLDFVVKGRPDSAVMAKFMFIEDGERSLKAKHWSKVLKYSFDPKNVPNVLLVHAVLQPDEGEETVDEIHVAQIAVNHGPLFLQLFGAALQVLGLAALAEEKASSEDGTDPYAEAAVKNSEGAA